MKTSKLPPTLLDNAVEEIRLENNSKLTFKTEWSEAEFKQMEKAILKHFKGKEMNCNGGRKGHNYYVPHTYEGIDEILGLAYTSSGVHACYSICNTELHYDNVYSYQFFILSSDGVPYAELWDKDENEKYIAL